MTAKARGKPFALRTAAVAIPLQWTAHEAPTCQLFLVCVALFVGHGKTEKTENGNKDD